MIPLCTTSRFVRCNPGCAFVGASSACGLHCVPDAIGVPSIGDLAITSSRLRSFSGGATNLALPLVRDHCGNAGGVVSPVSEFPQSFDDDRTTPLLGPMQPTIPHMKERPGSHVPLAANTRENHRAGKIAVQRNRLWLAGSSSGAGSKS